MKFAWSKLIFIGMGVYTLIKIYQLYSAATGEAKSIVNAIEGAIKAPLAWPGLLATSLQGLFSSGPADSNIQSVFSPAVFDNLVMSGRLNAIPDNAGNITYTPTGAVAPAGTTITPGSLAASIFGQGPTIP